MPQDAFTVYHTSCELDKIIKGARIERINQPTKDVVVLYIRCEDKNNRILYLSANANGARVCLTKDNRPAPIQAPAFCMLLRKHLYRSSVNAVRAVPYERIIEIDFDCKDELGTKSKKTLICEIMGKYSNITLTENGVILGAMKQTELDFSYSRQIFPGAKYVYPTPQNKVSGDDEKGLKNALSEFDGTDLANFIFLHLKGLSLITAEEIALQYEKQAIMRGVKTFIIDDFIKVFRSFYESKDVKANIAATTNLNDFFVRDYESVQCEKRYFSTLNEAIDFYFTDKENKNQIAAKRRKLLDTVKSQIKKASKKLQIENDKLLACKDYENNKFYGELILSNLYRIKDGASTAVVEDYTKEDYPTIEIKLDKTISPKENAERYFKKYNKQKKTIAAVVPQKTASEEELKYLETIVDEIENAETFEDFDDISEELEKIGVLKVVKTNKKDKKRNSPYRNFSYCGFDISVGRNNVQNDRLVSEAERNDVWLHTKDYHSSHVIIRTNGRTATDEVLLFAAEICAFYSKGRSADKIPVDYTLKKHVKKPAGAKLGFVYYTEQKTIFVTPDAHADKELH